MKTEHPSTRHSSLHALLSALAITALLFGILAPRLSADPGGLKPSVQFTQGLLGKQVCLNWEAQPGVQYVVQKSATLTATGTPGGTGPFKRVALVTAGGPACQWVDPESPSATGYYRIEIPEPQVFALEPPVLSPTGGEILVRAQLLPAGSFLALEIPGQPTVFAALIPVAGQPGVWRANIAGITGGAVAGIVLTARVVDFAGVTVCLVDQTLEITESGYASDAPPTLPPAAPTVTKKMMGSAKIGEATAVFNISQAASGEGPALKTVLGTFTLVGCGLRSQSALEECDDENDALIAAFLSRKGYQYYMARSDLNAAGLNANPLYQGGGVSVLTAAEKTAAGNGREYLGPYYGEAKVLYNKSPNFFPNPDKTNFRIVTGEEASAARQAFEDSGLGGHHVHPIAHGGPAIPGPGGLTFTGESTIRATQLKGLDLSFYKAYGKGVEQLKIYQSESDGIFQFGLNPEHTEATTFWNKVMSWQESQGQR